MKSKKSQNLDNYIKCTKCNGYYELKEGECLDDFKKCSCGGELKYAKSNYIPKKEAKEIKSTEKPIKPFFVSLDILIVLLITMLCVIFVLTPKLTENPVRIILGFLFALFLPGYSLIAALFPKKDDLDTIERLALSFGLSIAVTTLIGLLSNYTPYGIRLEPILVSLSVFTILMCIIAFIRRFKLPDDDKFSINFNYFRQIKGSFNKESGLDKILSVILVISIILAISMTVYAITTPKQGEKFTEFYLLGPNGKASDYPNNLTVGQSGNLIIGLVNHEYATVNYKIIVKLNNQTVKEENIILANNEKYEKPFNFNISSIGNKQKLEFLLYKIPGNSTAYRSLHLWVNIS